MSEAMAALPYIMEVREYIAYCEANPHLDARYHPTGDGAVKMIWHRGKDAADSIRQTFAAVHRQAVSRA